ncbi:SIR2 family protein [Allobranchiibius sp. GilTou73]|uniref:SIR2 family protein n=1 Tax=Allobranchiibius sp. GilTou73 TaxID=2904523 RepID=UPI001F1B1BF4|nr:SIR2 family protein [Allobranchiibius sp. GilTou73]UIJ35071.1 SIR2 family protein [Allobranchiibius sp. GilTou73]
MADLGHLFVVRGKLESVYCDALIVPTDSSAQLERTWDGVLSGVRRPERLENGFARALRDDSGVPVWYQDVTERGEVSIDALVKHLSSVLEDVAAANLETTRARPLVAVPALGLAGGGHHGSAGAVIGRVMEALQAGADGIDIAFVLFSESDYAAAQWVRRQSGACDTDDALHKTQSRLADLTRKGGLSLLIGAGVSIGAGLPSWTDLIEDLRSYLTQSQKDALGKLSVLDQAEYLAAVKGTKLGSVVADKIKVVQRPALGHLLLASLGCRAVATTNYDTLYENAVAAQAGAPMPTLLPYDGPAPGGPWVLKLHGDVDHPEDVVLARSEFIAYDAKNGPAGAIFQSMLLTTHLLAVGVSFRDDNILRLTHEVAGFVEAGGSSQKNELGTVLALGGDELQAAIWGGRLHWVAIGEDSDESLTQARELEIFLDHVAMHASVSSSYLLDPRYAALTEEDSEVIAAARAVADIVPKKPSARDRWKLLRDSLAALGYKHPASELPEAP